MREFFDKKVAWPQSPGSGSTDTGTILGREHGICPRDLVLIKGNLVFTLDFEYR